MPLSTSSSIIIDLLLLSDAAAIEDQMEVRLLAKRLESTADIHGCPLIAGHARTVGQLAAENVGAPVLQAAVGRMLAEAERTIHATGYAGEIVGAWPLGQ